MRVCLAFILMAAVLFPISGFSQSSCNLAFKTEPPQNASILAEKQLIQNKRINQLASRLSESELYETLGRVIYQLNRGDEILIENLDAASAEKTMHYLKATQYISFDGVPGGISIVQLNIKQAAPHTRGRNVQINTDGTFTLVDPNQFAIPMFDLLITKAF